VVQPSPNEMLSSGTPPVVITPTSFFDTTTRFAQPPTPSSGYLDTSPSQSLSPQGILVGKHDTDQGNMTEEGNDMDAKKRNSIQKIGTALGGSILLNAASGLQPFSLVHRGAKLHDEELLDICETEIPDRKRVG